MDETNDESVSIFVEYFGGSPYIKVLDFLISGLGFDYSMTEVARGAGVGWSAFVNVWQKLLDREVIVATRTIGNAKLFTLNKKNEFVKGVVKLDLELTKFELEKAYEGNVLPHKAI
ncbi:MAG TPA: hypothetical protein VJK07_03675 [Candidatus Nanoarchaeia archaeon]|nr:hypothetical protein [Candidatus Nanoarchaeia archaeon]